MPNPQLHRPGPAFKLVISTENRPVRKTIHSAAHEPLGVPVTAPNPCSAPLSSWYCIYLGVLNVQSPLPPPALLLTGPQLSWDNWTADSLVLGDPSGPGLSPWRPPGPRVCRSPACHPKVRGAVGPSSPVGWARREWGDGSHGCMDRPWPPGGGPFSALRSFLHYNREWAPAGGQDAGSQRRGSYWGRGWKQESTGGS